MLFVKVFQLPHYCTVLGSSDLFGAGIVSHVGWGYKEGSTRVHILDASLIVHLVYEVSVPLVFDGALTPLIVLERLQSGFVAMDRAVTSWTQSRSHMGRTSDSGRFRYLIGADSLYV